jgi:hypothetical protein
MSTPKNKKHPWRTFIKGECGLTKSVIKKSRDRASAAKNIRRSKLNLPPL